MAAAISGPKTNYVERDRSWRWSEEPKQRGSLLDLLVEPLNLAHIFWIPDVIRGWGHNGNNGNLLPGTISGGGEDNPADDDPR